MWLGVLLVSLPRAYCKKTKVGELAVGKDTSRRSTLGDSFYFTPRHCVKTQLLCFSSTSLVISLVAGAICVGCLAPLRTHT
jgi:hypothetical protein